MKLSTAMRQRIDELEERSKNREKYLPISTGIRDLDNILNGGFPRADPFYASIVGRMKRGKTAIGVQFFLQYAIMSGLKAKYYNLEETWRQLADRTLALSSAGPNRTDIFKLNLGEKDFEYFRTIANDYDAYEIYTSDAMYKLVEIFRDAEENNVEVLGLDNFQLFTDGEGDSQREKLMWLSKYIMYKRNEGKRIFLLSQGNPDGKSFGSTQVEMDSDLTILIENAFDDKDKKKANPIKNLRHLQVTVCRYAPDLGGCDVLFDGAHSRIRDVTVEAQDPNSEEFVDFEEAEYIQGPLTASEYYGEDNE